MTADEAPHPSASAAAADPRPTPPVRPDPDDCCHSGCDPCVFDLYDEEVTRYRAALAAWEARHAEPLQPGKREGRPRRKR
ncbi:oxidoreductase-like domain-containing protein [Paraburkholderia azotifigens]|uniref:oxidoreductase-like domain-containing protein n=1 Tax=Paraburkholderia azotifigens TaxID=2057004 RepID=UPI00316D2C04